MEGAKEDHTFCICALVRVLFLENNLIETIDERVRAFSLLLLHILEIDNEVNEFGFWVNNKQLNATTACILLVEIVVCTFPLNNCNVLRLNEARKV